MSDVDVVSSRAALTPLLTGWSLTDQDLEAAAHLAVEVHATARKKGHGLTSMSVSFAERRFRVAVVDGGAPAPQPLLTTDSETAPGGARWTVAREQADAVWFELTVPDWSRSPGSAAGSPAG